MIDLTRGQVRIRDGHAFAELSKAETLISRDTKDLTDLLAQKLGRTLLQTYYFHRDPLDGNWECISGPRGLRVPDTADWPSAQRGR